MQAHLITGNIFSLLASVCTAMGVVKKSKTDFMYWQVGNTVFAMLTNLALFSFTGITTNAVSLVRNVLAYKNKLSVAGTVIIVAVSVALGLTFNNRGIIGLLPVFSSAAYTACVYLTKNEQQLRYALIVDLSLWSAYYLYIQGYPSVVTYTVLNVWTAINIYKNRK